MRFILIKSVLFPVLSLLLTQCNTWINGGNAANLETDWHNELNHELKVLGARNWIVVAEPSFASLSAKGAKTIVTDEPSTEVLSYIFDTLESYSHTNPTVYKSLELDFVGEDYAPGIKSFRKQLNSVLVGRNTQEAQHETLRRLVMDAAKNYNVLIVKTSTALPFSNIYIELDSGYWSTVEETALRQKMEEKNQAKKKEDKKETSTPPSSGATTTSNDSSSDNNSQPPVNEAMFNNQFAI